MRNRCNLLLTVNDINLIAHWILETNPTTTAWLGTVFHFGTELGCQLREIVRATRAQPKPEGRGLAAQLGDMKVMSTTEPTL
jgi:hypothetical protein